MLTKDKMVFDYQVLDNVYEEILFKRKSVEIRLLNDKSQKINVGDYLLFHRLNDLKKIKVRVTKKEIFNSLGDLFMKIDTKKILTNSSQKDIENLLKNIYKEAFYQSKFVAFYFEYEEEL